MTARRLARPTFRTRARHDGLFEVRGWLDPGAARGASQAPALRSVVAWRRAEPSNRDRHEGLVRIGAGSAAWTGLADRAAPPSAMGFVHACPSGLMFDLIYDALIAPFTEFEFMRRALAAVIALALGGAPIGVFLMLRRMSLVGDAMAHAILPGAAIGFLVSGLNL
ncbi:MAG: zinc transporter permease, partial [Tardiphaga sp.]|nr:zinc transporter permease [Tardiphaga sp.]